MTDGKNVTRVNPGGIPLDLFREGQGIVAEGQLIDGRTSFRADNVLAKHDENYKAEGSGRRAEKAGLLERRLVQETRSARVVTRLAGGNEMIDEVGHYALVPHRCLRYGQH